MHVNAQFRQPRFYAQEADVQCLRVKFVGPRSARYSPAGWLARWIT